MKFEVLTKDELVALLRKYHPLEEEVYMVCSAIRSRRSVFLPMNTEDFESVAKSIVDSGCAFLDACKFRDKAVPANADLVKAEESFWSLMNTIAFSPTKESKADEDVCEPFEEFCKLDFDIATIPVAQLDERNELYWQCKRAFDEGRLSQEEFKDIQRRHYKFYDDISEGLIVVLKES